MKTHYNPTQLVISVDDGTTRGYEVDLEACTDSASMLDWLLQVAAKDWCTPETLADLVRCLEEACRDRFGASAQAVFCPFEQDQEVDFRQQTRRPKR